MARAPLEVRFSQPFHLTLAAIGLILVIVASIFWFVGTPPEARELNQMWLMGLCGLGLIYYAIRSIRMLLDRRPQIVVDRKGIRLGFGRDEMIPWSDIEWIRVRGLRPVLQLGIPPEAFVRLDLSIWRFDDNLAAVPGAGSAVGIKANGLDTSISTIIAAMLEWSPTLQSRIKR